MRGGGSSRKEKAQSWIGGGGAQHRRVRKGLCHPDPGRGEGSTATPASLLQSQTKHPSTAAPAPREGRNMRRRCAPIPRRHPIGGRGLGGRTRVGPAAPESRAGAREGGGGALLGRPRAPGPEAGPTGGAAAPCSCGFPRACNPAVRRPRRQRQVSAICSHSGGGGGGGGRRPAEESGSRALRNHLCSPWWTGARPASLGDSPPRGPASAVLICPQFSGFSSPEPLRPLHLEDLGGFPGGCSVFF